MRNRHAKEPSKGKNNKRRNPRHHHKDGNSFQVAVPFKKPSTRKNKNKRQKNPRPARRNSFHKA